MPHSAASDQALHCLPRPVRPSIKCYYGMSHAIRKGALGCTCTGKGRLVCADGLDRAEMVSRKVLFFGTVSFLKGSPNDFPQCMWRYKKEKKTNNFLQYNLNGSNPDGSFTVDDSNSFFSPYKILPIAQENKYLEIFSYFIMELYVVCTH